MIKILKKNGELQNFNGEKIKRAIRKSAERVCVTLTEKNNSVIAAIGGQQLIIRIINFVLVFIFII